jgi:hypothetical protein
VSADTRGGFSPRARDFSRFVMSVGLCKATIEKAEEVGTAPTIRTSQVQYFVDSADVRKLEGAKSQTLKAILNATIQAKRAYKKDFSANSLRLQPSRNSSAQFLHKVSALRLDARRTRAKLLPTLTRTFLCSWVQRIWTI